MNSSMTGSAPRRAAIGVSPSTYVSFHRRRRTDSLSPLDIDRLRGPQEMQIQYSSLDTDDPTPGQVSQPTNSFECTNILFTPPATPRLRTIPLPLSNAIPVLTEALRCGVMSQIGLAAAILSTFPIEYFTTYAWWRAAATRPDLDRMHITIPLLNEKIVVCGSGLYGIVCVGDVIHEIRRCWHRRRRPSYDQPGWGPSIGGPSNSPQSPGSALQPHQDYEWLGLTLRTDQHAWDLVLVDNDDAW